MLWNALREYDTVSAEPISPAATSAPSTTLIAKGASRAAVDVRRFPWIRPLAGDYAYNFTHVASLYAGDPSRPDAWRDVIGRVQRHARRSREIAAILSAQQERRGAPPAARAAAARLADPNTVAVLTGQQAGVFGGPMYTLLKAITAIQLARRISEEQGSEVVPIFWVDAEDHDWEEVASCTVLDAEFRPRTVTLAPPEGAGIRPVATLTVEPGIEHTIEEVGAALARTDFTDEVLAALRDTYRPGAGISHAFAKWLESVLGGSGLVVFESADPAAKPLVAEVFARELETAGTTAAHAAAAGKAMAALGHAPQVEPQPDQPSLFHIDGTRTPIRRQGDGFAVGEQTFARKALADEARREPSHFSPNVLLRPIVQDTLFPTISYVAGPSELAYLGQLGGVYAEFGVPMPLMFPRASATVIDAAAARFLRKYPLHFEELQPQDESALNRLLEAQLPASVEQALREGSDTIRRVMNGIAQALPAIDPTLTGAAKTTLGKMEHDLRGLHTKVIHAAKKRDETLRRQFVRVQAQVFPLGHPQERTLAVIHFLNQYGPALVERLLEELPLDMGQHWVASISSAKAAVPARPRAPRPRVRARLPRSSMLHRHSSATSDRSPAIRVTHSTLAPSLPAQVRLVSSGPARSAGG